MSEADVITLPCPHCDRPLRAKTASAGKQVWCPHPDCQRAVQLPLSLEDEDEPEEAVLLPEDPSDPQPVPVATAPVCPRATPVAPPAPTPRRKRRRYEDEEESKARGAILPWTLTACALLLASGAVVGWVVTATRNPTPVSSDSADRVAALEAKNRELRAENQKLRDQLAAPKTVNPVPKGPDAPIDPREICHEIPLDLFNELIEAGQLWSLTLLPEGRVEGEVRDPAYQRVNGLLGVSGKFAVKLPPSTDLEALVGRVLRADARYRSARVRAGRDEPVAVKIFRHDRPGAPPVPPVEPKRLQAAPLAKAPAGRDAFVGKWTVTNEVTRQKGVDVSIEFRADGVAILNLGQERSGTWRWDERLRVEFDGRPWGDPFEVKWNGPDEFVGIHSDPLRPLTFRRRVKP
jgi:hypothetical protein